jgi:MFS family permease
VATAFAWDFWSFMLFRVFAGMGIGGEYSAINSAVDELVPARVRGRVALAINSTWWVGAGFSALFSVVLLNTFAADVGWRIAFGLGAVLALAIIVVRRFVPESPRWLLTHGRADEAEQVVRRIEDEVRKTHPDLPEPEGEPIEIEQRRSIGFVAIARHVMNEYPSRGVLGLALMISQAFLYNAVFFTYGLVLTNFFEIEEANVGWFLVPFAFGNLLGPWVLGPLFDSLGRRIMLTATYGISGAILLVTAYLFAQGAFTAVTLTIAWSICFFFASAGASAAYLTVSEIFPMETRAMAIALFYAAGTGVNILAPWFFGTLIGTGDPTDVAIGFAIGGSMMIIGAIVAAFLAVDAERRSLEDVARPLTAVRAAVARRRPVAAARGR